MSYCTVMAHIHMNLTHMEGRLVVAIIPPSFLNLAPSLTFIPHIQRYFMAP